MDDPFRILLGHLHEGIVVDRPNRFVAIVRLGEDEDGGQVLCHVADSGRLKELIYPGNKVMVRKVGEGNHVDQVGQETQPSPLPNRAEASHRSSVRKTSHDLVLAAGSCGRSVGCKPLAGCTSSDGCKSLAGCTSSDGGKSSESADAVSPTWVSVDTRYPTRLFGQVLRARAVPEFSQYDAVRPEYPFHLIEQEWVERRRMESLAAEDQATEGHAAEERATEGPATEKRATESRSDRAQSPTRRKTPRSRLDFYLEGAGVLPALVEVKSVTLCVDGVGLFPDAPTDRGVRHLGELQKAVGMGYAAYAVFIAQREDIMTVSPNVETDPKFAAALKEARDHGVRLLAYRCRVTPQFIVFVPVAIPVIV